MHNDYLNDAAFFADFTDDAGKPFMPRVRHCPRLPPACSIVGAGKRYADWSARVYFLVPDIRWVSENASTCF